MTESTHLAYCPVQWCQYIAIVNDPEDEWEAAESIAEHVNLAHDEKDMEFIEECTEEEFDKLLDQYQDNDQ